MSVPPTQNPEALSAQILDTELLADPSFTPSPEVTVLPDTAKPSVSPDGPMTAPVRRGDRPLTPEQQGLADKLARNQELVRCIFWQALKGHHSDPKGAINEVVVRMARTSLDLEADPRPYAVAVTRRLCIDERRRRTSRPGEILTYFVSLRSDPATGKELGTFEPEEPEQYEHRSELRIITTDLLSTLSPTHRQIIEEVYLGDLTLSEAADKLGIPLGTAKSRVFYALQALRDTLNERGITRKDLAA